MLVPQHPFLSIKKTSIAIISLTLSLAVEASIPNPESVPDFEDVKSAESIFMESVSSETNDMTYASLALLRCSAMVTIMEGYLKQSGQNIDIADETSLLMQSVMIKSKRLADINGDLGSDEAMKEAYEEVEHQIPPLLAMYANRISLNKLKTGDSWASDPKFKDEIEFCKQVASIFK